MKTATAIFLCVTVFGVGLTHSPGGASKRCLCKGKPIQSVRNRLVNQIEVYFKSAFCEKIEIIAIMKNGKKNCLSPDSKQGKIILKKQGMEPQRKKTKKQRRSKKLKM
ncbi:hypothetical protein UPYG_G00278170 [Umbra pygmaea]|uniref:Chemokine interleukin-8-like domain-containing protein n=1 Tax=Umbra pygmaea TaxID=75934 RepID=A0ABD0W3C2_UMBPY